MAELPSIISIVHDLFLKDIELSEDTIKFVKGIL
jgi:hypothetical protein